MHEYSFAQIDVYTKLPVDATDIFPARQFYFIGVIGATLRPQTQKSMQANFVDRFGDIMDLTSFRLTVGSIRVERFFWVPKLVLLEKIIHFTFRSVLLSRGNPRTHKQNTASFSFEMGILVDGIMKLNNIYAFKMTRYTLKQFFKSAEYLIMKNLMKLYKLNRRKMSNLGEKIKASGGFKHGICVSQARYCN